LATPPGAQYSAQRFERLLGAEAGGIFAQEFGQPDDRVEGRAQLVAHIGEKTRFDAARLHRLVARLFRSLSLYDPSKLLPDVSHYFQQRLIRLYRHLGEELHDSYDLCSYRHRETEASPDANICRCLRPRKIRVFGHICDPCWFPAGQNPTRQANSRFKAEGLADPPERFETASFIEVP